MSSLTSCIIHDHINRSHFHFLLSFSHSLPVEERGRKRQRRSAPETWEKNIRKMARLEGKVYSKDTEGRKLGETCTSAFCLKSKLRACSNFTEETRKGIFSHFWIMKTWEERKTYVRSLVQCGAKKQVKVALDSRRENSFSFYMQNENKEKQQVCRNMFATTIGMSVKTVNNWLRETQTPEETRRDPKHPKSGKTLPVSAADRESRKEWLNKIPTVPSHYCRQTDTYKGKKFIMPGKSLTQLHKDYTTDCSGEGKRAVGQRFFSETFYKENFSFFRPRKDQCDLCIGFQQGNCTRESYDIHITRKIAAQQEKIKDKDRADETCSVWTMDVQSVMTCPRTNASALYYRTKLTLHNMTYFNLKTKEAFCYVYDETNGSLSSQMFGWLHHRHFSQYLAKNPSVKKLVIYSDGCGYQNKCSSVANCFLQLALEQGITIEQKYLVSGHTQMECDSMHSVIERRICNCDIFVPRDYIVAMQAARSTPFPYEVSEVTFSEPQALSGEYIRSIRPGKKAGDPTVSDVCAYQYTATDGNAQISYKLFWDDDWKHLPERLSPQRKFWQQMNVERLPITTRKYNDLQAMKSVMPQSVHHFYDNLPHK